MKKLGILIAPLILIFVSLNIGCLRTREDLKEVESAKAMRDQVDTLQKVHADSSSQLEELMDQNRQLNGRIEELEQRLNKASQNQSTGKDDLQKSLVDSKKQSEVLQEGIVKLENQVQALQEEIVSLKTKNKIEANSSSDSKEANKESNKEKSKNKEKDLMDLALTEFQDKKWKEAILKFDQYREKYPNGKFVPEATYKSGVSFQELGMIDEAKVFYNEVIEKFPKTDMAKKSQIRLKSVGTSKK